KADIKEYEKIPFNDKLLFDLLLRNLTIEKNGEKYLIDVGINQEEIFSKNKLDSYFESKIEDWGDLSIFYGHEELDLTGYKIKESKIFEEDTSSSRKLSHKDLIKKGFGFIRVNDLPIDLEYSDSALNLIKVGTNINLEPGYQKFANFTVWNNNQLVYNIINGFIYNVDADINKYNNGLIFR
ncbi:MAG: hypothetical protein KDC67_12835, partial [Ignavibacteriae bacterium]|nr:hypothetical protein [Ignavibacteriota bacterium]